MIGLTLKVRRIVKQLEILEIELSSIDGYSIPEKHEKTFNFLWTKYWELNVPNSGQSKVLQAEMLRKVEKIQNENETNGNINWDEDFDYFCDWLKIQFENFRELDSYINDGKLILDKLKLQGHYVSLLSLERFPEKYFKSKYLACCNNSLYDYLYTMICIIYENNRDNIIIEVEKQVLR